MTPVAQGLCEKLIRYPLTIIYIPLKWCGFGYKIFESVLGSSQYYPKGSLPIPENRLFAQFHSPQTSQMKDEILKQLCSEESRIRVIFATVALGMGVDIHNIRNIHITPPYTKLISRRLAGLGEMDNQQLQYYITTIGISQRTNVECRKQSVTIVRLKASASETCC